MLVGTMPEVFLFVDRYGVGRGHEAVGYYIRHVVGLLGIWLSF